MGQIHCASPKQVEMRQLTCARTLLVAGHGQVGNCQTGFKPPFTAIQELYFVQDEYGQTALQVTTNRIWP